VTVWVIRKATVNVTRPRLRVVWPSRRLRRSHVGLPQRCDL